MRGEPPVGRPALREGDERATDADAAARGVGRQHPELGGAGVERVHPDDADEPAADAGHGEFLPPDQLGDLPRIRAAGAIHPEAGLRDDVHAVDEFGDRGDERGIVGGVGGFDADVECVEGRGAHRSILAVTDAANRSTPTSRRHSSAKPATQ